MGFSSLDLSDPRAIDWWRSNVQSVLRDYDLDGWMQDFGEQAPDDGVYASGLPGVDEHNLYPVRYAQDEILGPLGMGSRLPAPRLEPGVRN